MKTNSSDYPDYLSKKKKVGEKEKIKRKEKMWTYVIHRCLSIAEKFK